MTGWRVTGGHYDSASRGVFTVTKGNKRLDHREANELEALLNPWPSIESAPRDGTQVILRRGKRITTGALIQWGNAHPEYDSNGAVIGHGAQEPGEIWSSADGGFTKDEPPTSWMPLN
jgi:hypothetical protein